MSFSAAALARSTVIGFATGLRSQLGLAGIALAARDGAWASATAGRAALAQRTLHPRPALPLRLLSTPNGVRGAVLGAGGELIADKLPSTPSRMKPPMLAARFATGAVAAVALAQLRGVSEASRLAAAAGTGAVAALVGSKAGASYRAAGARAGKLPDPVVALGEDAAAVGLVVAALHL